MPLIMLVAELAWFLPLFLLQGKRDAVSKKYTIFAILTGLVFGILVGVGGTGFFNMLLTAIAPNGKGTWTYEFFFDLLCAGVAEEVAKFFIALIFIRLAKPTRKLDYAFIMGGSALGFAVTESLMYAVTGGGGIINAFLPMHIMWQFYMGLHFYEAEKAKKEGNKSRWVQQLILAFAVPILMHGMYDFMVAVNQAVLPSLQLLSDAGGISSPEAESALVGFCLVLAWFALMFVFVIVMEVKVAKLVKQSREADRALAREEADGKASKMVGESAEQQLVDCED